MLSCSARKVSSPNLPLYGACANAFPHFTYQTTCSVGGEKLILIRYGACSMSHEKQITTVDIVLNDHMYDLARGCGRGIR